MNALLSFKYEVFYFTLQIPQCHERLMLPDNNFKYWLKYWVAPNSGYARLTLICNAITVHKKTQCNIFICVLFDGFLSSLVIYCNIYNISVALMCTVAAVKINPVHLISAL